MFRPLYDGRHHLIVKPVCWLLAEIRRRYGQNPATQACGGISLRQTTMYLKHGLSSRGVADEVYTVIVSAWARSHLMYEGVKMMLSS